MTHPVRSDSRYTVSIEYCGYEKPRHVARWCGDFIGSASSYPAAVMICTTHRCRREGGVIAEVLISSPHK